MSHDDRNMLDVVTPEGLCEADASDASGGFGPSPTGVRRRNRRLVRARQDLGFDSAKAAARQLDLNYGLLVRYEARTLDPWNPDGAWKESAVEIAEAYGCLPDELWPDTARRIRATHARLTRGLVVPAALPDASLEHGELRRELNRALHHVSGREEEVLRLRFGIGRARTMEVFEIAAHFELTAGRIHQQLKRALEHLRNHLPDYDKTRSWRSRPPPPPTDADRVLQALGAGEVIPFSWLAQYRHLRPHALDAIWNDFRSGRSGVVLLERLVRTDACGLADCAGYALARLKTWAPVTADDVRLYVPNLWCTLASLMQALGYADEKGAFYEGWYRSYCVGRTPARGENR